MTTELSQRLLNQNCPPPVARALVPAVSRLIATLFLPAVFPKMRNLIAIFAARCGRWTRAAALPSFIPLLVTMALCAPGAGDSWAPGCDETRNGNYTFEGLGGSAGQPAKIYVCPDVSCGVKKDFATVRADSYSAPAPAGLARPYFLVERSANGTSGRRIIAARRLALEGAYNFRDLGGMRTADGKTVRWGLVFRSDSLTHLTAHDYERLNAIGISTVCDLRSREERKADPTDWKNGSPVFVIAPVSEDDKGQALDRSSMQTLLSGQMTLEQRQKIFEGFYVRMVFDSAAKFGAVLRAIATTDHPAMFHCTGGRDRTGITAALLLHILGVPGETIAEDYVLSTKYLNENPAMPAYLPPGHPEQARLFAEVIRLQPRYIEAVFKAIDERYGNFDRYRREALHLTDVDVAALRARLLE